MSTTRPDTAPPPTGPDAGRGRGPDDAPDAPDAIPPDGAPHDGAHQRHPVDTAEESATGEEDPGAALDVSIPAPRGP